MSMGSLGSAVYTVTANTNAFEAGLKRAEAGAKRTHQVVSNEIGGLAADTRRKLDSVGRSVEGMTAKLGMMGKSSRAGLGLMALGNMVDDLQYGFRSIVNNIPQVTYLLGGSAGIAGGAAIAAVAVNQLVQHWDKLTDSMQASWLWGGAGGDLNKARFLEQWAEDAERLRIRAEAAGEAFDKLMRTPSKVRTGQIKALEEAFVGAEGGGPPMALKMISEAIQQHQGMRATTTAADVPEMMKRALQKTSFFKDIRPMSEILKEIKGEMIAERNAAKARELIGLAASGEKGGKEALGTILTLMKMFPKTFEGFEKFRKAMAETTEEAVEHKEANRKAAAAFMRGGLETELLLGGEGGGARRPAAAFTPQALLERTRKIRQQRIDELDKRAAAMGLGKPVHRPGDFMDEARKQAKEELLKEAKAKGAEPGALEKKVAGQLGAAGVKDVDAAGVLKDMKEMTKERVRAVQLEQGLTEQQARMFLLRERMHHLDTGLGGRTVGLLEQGQLGGRLNVMPELARKQLDELMRIRQALQQGMGLGAAGAAAINGAALAIAGGPR